MGRSWQEAEGGGAGPGTEDPLLARLLAHRGLVGAYGENTLGAMDAALRLGVPRVELDVQLTRDLQPVLLHDPTLERTASDPRAICDLTLKEVRELRARHGLAPEAAPLPTLAEAVRLIAAWPQAEAFVEIKGASAARHGAERVTGIVAHAIRPLGSRSVIISFSPEVLLAARAGGQGRLGWCLPRYDEGTRAQLRALDPEVALVNRLFVPDDGVPLWPGSWHWAIYEIASRADACHWVGRGADLIETMRADRLLG